MANLSGNVLITKGLGIVAALFALCLFTNQQARAQSPQDMYYGSPTQQQPAGTAAPRTAYPQSNQQSAQPPAQTPAPAQPSTQTPQPAQPVYPQSLYPTPTTPSDESEAELEDEEPEAEEPELVKGDSDHEQAEGEIGLALLGILNMPIVATRLDETTGYYVPTVAENDELLAPTVGIRYWLGKTFGIEFGLGLGFSEGTLEQQTAATEPAKTDLPSTTAFTFHAGLPIALLYSDHFVFEIVPIVNGGYSTGTVFANSAVDPAQENNWDVSTLLLQVGSRVGAEIHFGFLGVKQLAVQASLGLQFSYIDASAETIGYIEKSSRVSLGTTVGSNPWDLFTKSISAIYYIY